MDIARKLLDDEHARIESLAPHLLEAMRADDPAAYEAAWAPLEERILSHLDDEEAYVFPVLEARHPEAVAQLRDEHAIIRRLTGELGIALDLHLVRLEHLERLQAFLRDHAETERHLLDEHLEELLPPGAISTLVRRAHRRERHTTVPPPSRTVAHSPPLPPSAAPCVDSAFVNGGATSTRSH